MSQVEIYISENRDSFNAGDTIEGNVVVILPEDIPVENVRISYNCVGEVKWTEKPNTAYYHNGKLYYTRECYHEEAKQITKSDVTSKEPHDFEEFTKYFIPFAFTIPKDKNLPTSMICVQGSIHHFIRVTIKQASDIVKYMREVIVQAPIEKDLMITVGGTVEKNVLLHGGKVSMHASIGRKGFALGESITVHVAVDNRSNIPVVPRLSLRQVQIYMAGERHKSTECNLTEESVVGAEIAAHSKVEELLDVDIPADESLSIKSSLITVKYFVHITLVIPHSLDLHINLPVVVTSQKVIDEFRELNESPKLIASNNRKHA